MLSNSRAVYEAFTGTGGNVFKRTPKFRVVQKQDQLASKRYALRPDWTTIGELMLGIYAVLGLIIALVKFPAMAIYMVVYVLAFGMLSLWSLWQTWRLNRLQA